jgi:hypothetical protein
MVTLRAGQVTQFPVIKVRVLVAEEQVEAMMVYLMAITI